MILLGLLLMLGAVALSAAAIWANQSAFDSSAGTFTLLGYSVDLTVAQVYLAGLVVGALGLLGILMIISGAGRRASRRAATRRQLREREDQLRQRESELADLQRERDTADMQREREKAEARAEARADARHRRPEVPARDESAREEDMAKH